MSNKIVKIAKNNYVKIYKEIKIQKNEVETLNIKTEIIFCLFKYKKEKKLKHYANSFRVRASCGGATSNGVMFSLFFASSLAP